MKTYTTGTSGTSTGVANYESVQAADITSCLVRLSEAVFEGYNIIQDIQRKVFVPMPADAKSGPFQECEPMTVSGHIEAIAKAVRECVDSLAHINGALSSALGELKLV